MGRQRNSYFPFTNESDENITDEDQEDLSPTFKHQKLVINNSDHITPDSNKN